MFSVRDSLREETILEVSEQEAVLLIEEEQAEINTWVANQDPDGNYSTWSLEYVQELVIQAFVAGRVYQTQFPGNVDVSMTPVMVSRFIEFLAGER